MDTPIFIHAFRLPFAFVSSVFAYYCISPTLQTKTSRRMLLGAIILHEVLVSVYLFLNAHSYSVTNDKNQRKGQILADTFDNTRRVMEATVMVCISKIFLTLLFVACKYSCTKNTSEEKTIPQFIASDNSLPIPDLHSLHKVAPDLPPPYHEAIQMS